MQETVIAVAKKMEHFRYDPAKDSFKGWLLYLTRKRIAMQYRRRERERGTGGRHGGNDGKTIPLTPEIDSLPDPADSALEALWETEWEQNMMDAALERVKQQVSPKQFQMFTFYALKGWPVKDVVRTLAVSTTQVYLAKHRIGAMIKKEIKNLQRKYL